VSIIDEDKEDGLWDGCLGWMSCWMCKEESADMIVSLTGWSVEMEGRCVGGIRGSIDK
jgi:Ni,Fe-hydrogenase III large subunit